MAKLLFCSGAQPSRSCCCAEGCSDACSVGAVQGSWDMMQQGDAGPALWSAEEPNLYILVLSLIAPDGSHVESESCQVHILTKHPVDKHQNGDIPNVWIVGQQ